MSDKQRIFELHGIVGTLLGIIKGAVQRDDCGPDLKVDMAVAADRVERQLEKFKG